MNRNKQIKLVIPQLVYNRLQELKDRENIFYLINLLLESSAIDRRIDDENSGYSPIDKDEFKKATGRNADSYIKFLLSENILQRDYYQVGVKAYYYRINPDLINNHFEVFWIENSKVHENIIRLQRNKRANYNRLDEYLKQMQRHVMKIPYDAKGAYNWIQNNATGDKKISYLIAVSNIADKRFRYFSRNKTNSRLDTNFTNLKSELRQFIVGDYVQIDLKNSQPFLLAMMLSSISADIRKLVDNGVKLNWDSLMNTKIERFTRTFGVQAVNHIAELKADEEIKLFLDWTRSGMFYDNFVNTFGNGATRQDIKNIMFAVLFSRNETYLNYQRFEPYSKEKAVFTKVFPNIAKIVEVLKEKEHSRLAIYLQQRESEIFIDDLARMLAGIGIIPITIHDSVIVRADEAENANYIIHEYFKSIGIVPTFEQTTI